MLVCIAQQIALLSNVVTWEFECDDGNIEMFCKHPSLSVSCKISLMYQAGLALCELHKKGFIHRDIKPTNIQVGEEYSVAISDLMTLTNVQRVIKSVKGTPTFMMKSQLEMQALLEDFAYKNQVRTIREFVTANDVYGFAKTLMQLDTKEQSICNVTLPSNEAVAS